MVIEDKGWVFVKASIIAIIDSAVYDLYYGKIVIIDNTSNPKKTISSDFHSGAWLIYFQWMIFLSIWLFIKLQINLLVSAWLLDNKRHNFYVISEEHIS